MKMLSGNDTDCGVKLTTIPSTKQDNAEVVPETNDARALAVRHRCLAGTLERFRFAHCGGQAIDNASEPNPSGTLKEGLMAVGN
jgi:hypothetical protein